MDLIIAPCNQTNTSSPRAITLVHTLGLPSNSQSASSSTLTIVKVLNLICATSVRLSSVTTATITQLHQLLSSLLTQLNQSSVGAIYQMNNITISTSYQYNVGSEPVVHKGNLLLLLDKVITPTKTDVYITQTTTDAYLAS